MRSTYLTVPDLAMSKEDARLLGMNEIGAIKQNSTIELEIKNKPTLRFIRNVSFTRLDFVVSIGGIIGLFFGASILGLAEIIYIWCIRKF